MTIPDRQGYAEELRLAASFMRRECMPAIFWPVNPFPHTVNEYEIMDCLHEAVGSIPITHAYDLACEMISEAAHQRWTEEMHTHQANKVEPPFKQHRHLHKADPRNTRHQVMTDGRRHKDCKGRMSAVANSPKGRGALSNAKDRSLRKNPQEWNWKGTVASRSIC